MTSIITGVIALIYFAAAGGLLIYGLHCYLMVVLYRRQRSTAANKRSAVRASHRGSDLPTVTTQIPIYNEYNVVERVIRAVCAFHYPIEKHQIQILDDSNDETSALIDHLVHEMRAAGLRIEVIRRQSRQGYKAGALAAGLPQAEGELIAIFDADFVPASDFLLRLVPFFLADPKVGLVQARWGHLNDRHSLLTSAQAIGIDGHFMVEQAARAWSGLFLNFNGTAGIWRRAAIDAAGGWEWDTLTEDMDLSYRAQLAGWRAVYAPDVVVPAEIPETLSALRSQQFRWAKGSIQTARKILPRLLRAPLPARVKIEAWFHLTHYLVHPLMLLSALLALPVLLSFSPPAAPLLYTLLVPLFLLSMMAPSTLYCVSQRAAYRDWRRRLPRLPLLVLLGVGLAAYNSRAVVEALLGHQSAFVRTPKRGASETVRYRVQVPWGAFPELFLGGYCLLSLTAYWSHGRLFVGPFLAIYALGFLSVGLLALLQEFALRQTARRATSIVMRPS
jgi:cellulose synthase/poly-beta-1,6-N-acetylglucosamine synthase-like glycosyltransferase